MDQYKKFRGMDTETLIKLREDSVYEILKESRINSVLHGYKKTYVDSLRTTVNQIDAELEDRNISYASDPLTFEDA